MADVINADDPRWQEMFDVRNEARSSGGVLIDTDMNDRFGRLREAAPVHAKGLHELMGVPGRHAGVRAQRPQYTAFSFQACNAAFATTRPSPPSCTWRRRAFSRPSAARSWSASARTTGACARRRSPCS